MPTTDQSSLNLKNKAAGSVECLGQAFASEDARREHYLKLLAQKLKDPEFRKIEGFPIGKDEDILALSDPPYYTACPNPWLGDFIKGYGTPFDPKQPYHREPFAADVSEGKNHPIYNAHSYHTKVPHRAIMRYLLHYTEPADVVFDGFCGTGMTGVAAQLCGDRAEVQELGYRVQNDGTILNEEGKPFSKLGNRCTILNDLSPAATFIAYNYNTPIDSDAFEREAKRILKEVDDELGWMYETTHTDGKAKGRIHFTIWSDVFLCPECSKDIIFWNVACNSDGTVNESFPCPSCAAVLTKRKLSPKMTSHFDAITQTTRSTSKQIPVSIIYDCGRRFQKKPDEADLKLIKKIESIQIPSWFPTSRMPEGDESRRNDDSGVTHVHHYFTKRNLFALSRVKELCDQSPLRRALRLFLNGSLRILSKQAKHNQERRKVTAGLGWVNAGVMGTLYISSAPCEQNVIFFLEKRAEKYYLPPQLGALPFISTASSNCMDAIPNSSLDYIFVDPPFGGNIMYSELNFMWESWLKLVTNNAQEAITNSTQKKALSDYQALMLGCFRQFAKKLKPGRWMTVEFSNTQASVWNAIQTTLQEAGFVVANVSFLDKQILGFKALQGPTAVKQDLVISAYKPNGGLEERFAKRGETEEGVWDFVRTHLKNLPVVKAKGGQLDFVAERDPRFLYDRMVAFYVGHSTPFQLSSAEFQAGLAEKFPEREGMYFLPEQVNEYDKKRAQVESIGQLSIFVEDERSAINWLRNFLKNRPSTSQDIQPEFMQQLGASWKKWEARPEMSGLLDQNFLCYDGTGEVPSQIHSYLSTQFKELRNLPKDHAQLKAKAKNRWYVPDPKKNVDVETLRNKRLLEEFWSYLPEGYTPPALTANKGQTLPGLTVPRPKIPKGKKLKELRTEAVRVGFKHCYQQKDYTTILVVAEMIPDSVLNEDEQLQMIYDTAVTRTGGGD